MTETVVPTSHLETTALKIPRRAPAWLIGAAMLFAIAWYLMPVAGETDAREIFRIVTPQRGAVLAAAILQLLAATLYVPAMIGIIRGSALPLSTKVWRPASILIVGTLGLATDAIDHLLSYAMTAPGVDQNAQVQVMEFMQGPALLLIAPLIGCFFVGAVWLSVAYAKAGAISRWNPALYVLALIIALGGAALVATTGMIDTRLVGILTLWAVAAAQLWQGVVLCRHSQR
jgi:hypothetical protein